MHWDNRRSILILDDSKEMREFCRLAFESAGYRVSVRDRALGSVAAILQERPDVVLLDVGMSNVSGEDIARILRRPARNRMLLILHSDLPLETLRLKAVRAGAHGYVQRTQSPTELVRSVEEWLQRSSSSRMASGTWSRAPAGRNSKSPGDEPEHVPDRSRLAISGAPSSEVTTSRSPRPSGDPGPSSEQAAPGRVSMTVKLPLKVLIADPDESLLTLFETSIGYEIRGEYTTSGDAALASIIGSNRPEVVVASMKLTGTSAPELYRCARAVDPSLAQRFVFLIDQDAAESDTDFVYRVEAYALHKPVSAERLLHAFRVLEPKRKASRAQ